MVRVAVGFNNDLQEIPKVSRYFLAYAAMFLPVTLLDWVVNF